MIADKQELIQRELEEGTGAKISVEAVITGLRTGLRIWFGDLDARHGPVAELKPFGLKGHQVGLAFGKFSGELIEQIKQASSEDVLLSRALIDSIRKDVELEIEGQNITDWSVTGGSFKMSARVREQENPNSDASIITTCRDVIVPMMASMAELIGYDVIGDDIEDVPAVDGAISQAMIKKRERNPRNRLLCIRIHGEKCFCCGLQPKQMYGDGGSIIEVHHLEPLSLLQNPRPYDPKTDLVPLCPNCHRAVHTRRPIPFDIEELRSLMEACNG